MKKLFALVVVLLLGLGELSAQTASIKSFREDPTDLLAATTNVRDLNGDNVAAVRVGVVGNDINFDGDIIKVEDNNGEYIIYMLDGATWLTVKGSNFSPLRYEFPTPLAMKKTYIMTVEIQAPGSSDEISITLPAKRSGIVIDGQEVVGKPVTFKMMRVKNGSFKMGGTKEQYLVDEDEQPVHDVRITRDFYMGETEVTQALWKYVMGKNPSLVTDDEIDLPVENISWDEANDFCQRLSELTGRTFRLPSEAEWEYAARGGHKMEIPTIYSGGNEPFEVAWFAENSGGRPHEVKTKAPNQLGIYDMSGNVWEMCMDYKNKYPSGSVTNYISDKNSGNRVRRGGSFDVGMEKIRTAFRRRLPITEKNKDTGLRIVMEK